jgi:hypothetical protein
MELCAYLSHATASTEQEPEQNKPCQDDLRRLINDYPTSQVLIEASMAEENVYQPEPSSDLKALIR